MKKNMDDFLDEYLFNKKPRFDYSDLLEKEESNNAIDQLINPVKTEYVFEATLDVNESEATIRLEKGEFSRKAITDFVSVVSLFKDSEKIPIKDFLTSVGIISVGPQAPITDPTLVDPAATTPETGAITPDTETPTTGAIVPEEEEVTDAKNVESEAKPIPDDPQKDKAAEPFKLNSFALITKEQVSQDGRSQVSINGVENVNGALGFKVMVNSDSSAFNTPESALSYFNKVFFDNIIQTIDREIKEE